MTTHAPSMPCMARGGFRAIAAGNAAARGPPGPAVNHSLVQKVMILPPHSVAYRQTNSCPPTGPEHGLAAYRHSYLITTPVGDRAWNRPQSLQPPAVSFGSPLIGSMTAARSSL